MYQLEDGYHIIQIGFDANSNFYINVDNEYVEEVALNYVYDYCFSEVIFYLYTKLNFIVATNQILEDEIESLSNFYISYGNNPKNRNIIACKDILLESGRLIPLNNTYFDGVDDCLDHGSIFDGDTRLDDFIFDYEKNDYVFYNRGQSISGNFNIENESTIYFEFKVDFIDENINLFNIDDVCIYLNWVL